MSKLTVEDWKIFLTARIDQEQGKDGTAIDQFRELLDKYPDDPHILASYSFSLQRLGRPEEAMASIVAAKYSVLGRALVNNNDKPEVWERELTSMLSDMDEFEASGKLSAALVAW